MAKVYEGDKGKKGKEIEGRLVITDAQAKARERWETTKSLAAKRAKALARQEARGARSAAEQLKALDKRLGVGVGAKKERARLEIVK